MGSKIKFFATIPILIFLYSLTSNFQSGSDYFDEYHTLRFCSPNFIYLSNISVSRNIKVNDKSEEYVEIYINNVIASNIFNSYTFLPTFKYFINFNAGFNTIINDKDFIIGFISLNSNNRSPPPFILDGFD